ncbi:copper homeostasis protein CutC [Olivibacter sp. SDN3]|uniref:copper homeostasis protein CutC n=1 Tax=Olivibacter sp. SDN3 TaxID=2764720 RepID=UPI00165110BA|nr:copper homeostasis protein CutC [Olivibacter sp. SDN3]QNL48318.1 copper homeostasis protein CutC [Olivibacter sp. SDN3]
MKLEICANSFASALAAQNGGAHRVELCENLNEGGTTPSYGTIKKVREQLHIQVYVLIRPRAGDFNYTDEEFEIMKADILNCKQLGCDGVVIGLLDEEGNVASIRTKELVKLASPMGVTFHRAFDCCNDGLKALKTIIYCGCERILTSGMQNTAIDGANFLKELVDKAGDNIIIMPGSGVNENNIQELIEKTNAKEYHTSAKVPVASTMNYQNPAIRNMGGMIEVSSEEKIRKITALL